MAANTEQSIESVKGYSVHELQDWLERSVPDISVTCLGKVLDNEVDGDLFLQLEEADLVHLASSLKDRIPLRRLQVLQQEQAKVIS